MILIKFLNNQEAKDFILSESKVNVIVVDWTKMAASDNYLDVQPKAPVVGAMVAHLINRLVTLTHAFYHDFHCIGHSLGAHICGFVGRALGQNKLAMITGLDPSGLGYEGLPKDLPSRPVNSSDANLVLILHTSAGMQLPNGVEVFSH